MICEYVGRECEGIRLENGKSVCMVNSTLICKKPKITEDKVKRDHSLAYQTHKPLNVGLNKVKTSEELMKITEFEGIPIVKSNLTERGKRG